MISADQIPLKYLATPVKNLNEALTETNLLSLSYGRIVRKDITSNESLLPESFNGYNIVQNGDVVLRLTDMQNDQRSLRSGLVTESGIITSAYLTLRPMPRIDSRYLAYSMHSLDTSKKLYALGGGLRQSLSFEELGAVSLLVPSIDEQRRIADFLDDQVARIDQVIALRQRHLQAVMDLRVGELDEAVNALDGRRVSFRRIGTPIKELNFGTLDVLSIYRELGVVPRSERTDNFNVQPADLDKYQRVKVGDLVVNKMKAWSGSVAVSDYEGLVSPDYLVCRLTSSVIPKYVHHVLRSHRFISEMRIRSKGIRPNQERLYWEDLGEIPIPLADLRSQESLVSRMEQAIGEHEIVRAPFLRDVSLLQELRTSLISAAVSGEFDVSAASGRGVPA